MKIVKKIFFYLLFSMFFLTSCDKKDYVDHSNKSYNPLNFSPIEQILKMNPVKITMAKLKEDVLSKLDEEDVIAAVNNPENWIVEFETTDANQISIIMVALNKPSMKYTTDMPPGEMKISFEDKESNVRFTMFALLSDLKEFYFSDRVYSKETYNVFAEILNNIKDGQIQEANAPAQKRRLNRPEKIPENTPDTYKDWYNYGILSPTFEIIKMHPVKIAFARIVIDNLPETETKENMVGFFSDINNLEINLEITDANEINDIMTALSKPSIEEGPWRLYYESWMIIADEHGNIKRTVIATHPGNTKEIFLYDRLYGEETYDVVESLLKKEKEEHYKKLKKLKE